jgi:recombinational DNA repair ATPase RecF
VFSELDERRRGNLLECLESGNQIIFTMIHKDSLGVMSDCTMYCIDEGGVIRDT